jgi:hypothetical protein
MSRWKLHRAGRGELFHLGRVGHRRRAGAQHSEASIDFRVFTRALARFAVLCALAFVWCGADVSRAQQSDFDVYARAVEYCRGVAKRPMAIDLDSRVLCFDGPIGWGTDVSLASALRTNGLFVVRSAGGLAPSAIALANMLRDRHATVVAYDYCFSACASFFLIASDLAFVMKDTLVGWHHTNWPFCPSLEVSKDGGPKRLEKRPCSDTPVEYQRSYRETENIIDEFYRARVIDPLFEQPPESFAIRRILKTMFEGTGSYPDVVWTWNPRYYTRTLRTKITYEAYPNSQDEVDALASKLPHRVRVLYDP